jgi:hypothetical protein
VVELEAVDATDAGGDVQDRIALGVLYELSATDRIETSRTHLGQATVFGARVDEELDNLEEALLSSEGEGAQAGGGIGERHRGYQVRVVVEQAADGGDAAILDGSEIPLGGRAGLVHEVVESDAVSSHGDVFREEAGGKRGEDRRSLGRGGGVDAAARRSERRTERRGNVKMVTVDVVDLRRRRSTTQQADRVVQRGGLTSNCGWTREGGEQPETVELGR